MRWVNRQVRRSDRILLGSLPILLLVVNYLFMAAQSHAANTADKILPLPGAVAESMFALLFQPDKLSGQLVFWADTLASIKPDRKSDVSGKSEYTRVNSRGRLTI